MVKFFLNEYRRLVSSKFVYPIRLFLQCVSLLLVCQWLYSAGYSIYLSGELDMVWSANWIFYIAPTMWVFYVASIIVLGKALSNNKKDSK